MVTNILLLTLGLVVIGCGTDQQLQDRVNIQNEVKMTAADTSCLEKLIHSEECDREFVEQCINNSSDDCLEMFYNCQAVENDYHRCETDKEINKIKEEISYEACYSDDIIRN